MTAELSETDVPPQHQALVWRFPRRPLRVQASWGQRGALWVGGAMGAAMVAFGLWVAINGISRILDDTEVHRDGVITRSSTKGSCTHYSPLPVSFCHLDVTYIGPRNRRLEARDSALLLFGLDDDHRMLVKYLPQDERRIAVSAFAEPLTRRWLALGLVVLLSLAVAGIVLWLTLRQLRELLLWRRLGVAPNPIIATIRAWDFEPEAAEGSGYRCRFSWKHAGLTRWNKQFFGRVSPLRVAWKDRPEDPEYDEPIWASDDKQHALALVTNDGRGLLVRRSLRPLVLTDDEKQTLLGAEHY
jgi:hypothetical protein